MNEVTLPASWPRLRWTRSKDASPADVPPAELDRLRIHNDELRHRLANSFTLVGALARRSAAGCDGLAEFLPLFEQRLAALARAQSQTLRAEGRPVRLATLISEELSALTGFAEPAGRIALEGPESVALEPRAAEMISLAVHELAVNSIKYGVLGAGTGRIQIAWRWRIDRDERRLRVEWHEIGLVRKQPPDRKRGFGSELIGSALPRQLGGKTTYLIDALGVACTIELPAQLIADPVLPM